MRLGRRRSDDSLQDHVTTLMGGMRVPVEVLSFVSGKGAGEAVVILMPPGGSSPGMSDVYVPSSSVYPSNQMADCRSYMFPGDSRLYQRAMDLLAEFGDRRNSARGKVMDRLLAMERLMSTEGTRAAIAGLWNDRKGKAAAAPSDSAVLETRVREMLVSALAVIW